MVIRIETIIIFLAFNLYERKLMPSLPKSIPIQKIDKVDPALKRSNILEILKKVGIHVEIMVSDVVLNNISIPESRRKIFLFFKARKLALL